MHQWFAFLFLFARRPMWHWRGMLCGSMFVILWLEQRNYCRRYHWKYCLLRHHHFHCILPLLCFLPVLPLSCTRCCDRHPTAATIARLNSGKHNDDAACTSSSAEQLQPASFRFPLSTTYLFVTWSKPGSSSWGTRTNRFDAASRAGQVIRWLKQVNMETTGNSFMHGIYHVSMVRREFV